MIKDLLRTIFPHYCPICDNILINQEEVICFQCTTTLLSELHYFSPNSQLKSKFYGISKLDEVISLYDLKRSGGPRTLVHHLKYHNCKKAGKWMGTYMAELLLKRYTADFVDYFVPIPLHKSKLAQRGYNQSAILAEQMVERLGSGEVKDVLSNVRGKETQTNLGRYERFLNTEGAFELNTELDASCRYLLVDDVLTTGATVAAAVKAIRKRYPNVWLGVLTFAYGTDVSSR